MRQRRNSLYVQILKYEGGDAEKELFICSDLEVRGGRGREGTLPGGGQRGQTSITSHCQGTPTIILKKETVIDVIQAVS